MRVLLILFLFASCGAPLEEDERDPNAEVIAPITYSAPGGNIITIGECEWAYMRDMRSSDIEHYPNCKYCKQREND